MAMRIAVVYGTRPEAIKCAPLIREIDASKSMVAVPVMTGQHGAEVEAVNEAFGIVVERNLAVLVDGQELNELAARTLSRLDEVLSELNPDAVVAQGDTAAVGMAAIAAYYRAIPFVHLEAGLRTGDRMEPFPEEGTRRFVGQLASLHLAPSCRARNNLLREGIPAESIAVVGNTVIDALRFALTLPFDSSVLGVAAKRLVESDRLLILVTAHRRENWGRLSEIAHAIRDIALMYPEAAILYSAHPNPAIRATIEPLVSGVPNVAVSNPVDYVSFAHLLQRSHIILTDSGGIQEEAPSLGKPVLVMRNQTERLSVLSSGAARLVGTQRKDIVAEVRRIMDFPKQYGEMGTVTLPYGDGRAAARAVEAIWRFLSSAPPRRQG